MASTKYSYSKTPVNVTKLSLEIEAEGFTPTLEWIDYQSPPTLDIWFDDALSGPEETALGTLVTNHDGNPPTSYPRFCMSCMRHFTVLGISAPTTCPYCGSSSIKADTPPFPFEIENALAADLTYSGFPVLATAGENVAFGDQCYLKSDGKMWKADASAEATADGLIFMAMATILANAEGVFLKEGFVRNDAWTWTVGGKLYISPTPGGPTQTKPTTTGEIVRITGYATHADKLYFHPDNSYVEVP